MRRVRKTFKTKDEADAYYEKRKQKVELAFPERERWFSYRNEWGNLTMVQKMYN